MTLTISKAKPKLTLSTIPVNKTSTVATSIKPNVTVTPKIDTSGMTTATNPPPAVGNTTNDYIAGQLDVVNNRKTLIPKSGKKFRVSFQRDGYEDIITQYGYLGKTADTFTINGGVSIEKFCGRMTAFVNVVLENSAYTEALAPDDKLWVITDALNALLEDMYPASMDEPDVISDYMLNECTRDTAELTRRIVPPGVDPATAYTIEEEYALDDEVGDEPDIYIDKYSKKPSGDNLSNYSYSKWSPKSLNTLDGIDCLDWSSYLEYQSADKYELPIIANDFVISVKNFCICLSEELYSKFDGADSEYIPELDNIYNTTPSKIMLLLNSSKDIKRCLSTIKIDRIPIRHIDLPLSNLPYEDFRDALANYLLFFAGCKNPVTDINCSYDYADLYDDCLEVIYDCIDRACYYAVLQDNNL